MRRSKENSTYWRKKREKIFTEYFDSKLVKNRYKTLYMVLDEKYGDVFKGHDKNKILELFKDLDYNNRQIRWETEENERELKKQLSTEWKVQNDYLPQIELPI